MARFNLLLGFLVVVVAMVATSTAAAPAGSTATASIAQSYVPGEVIVRFRSQHRSPSKKSAAISRLGAAAASDINETGYTRIKLSAGEDVERAIARYAGDPAIEHAQPNFRYLPQRLPNDPHFAQMWALKNDGQMLPQAFSPNNPGIAGSDMGLESAWELEADCRGILVAVVDTGVNYTHRDLADNMWDGSARGYPNHGYDFLDNDADPMPADGDGHGTHVAGAIAAVGHNGIGTTGVCWSARIMALRALDAGGGRTDTVVRAIRFAVDHGARVLNLSLGGSGYDRAFAAEIEYARTRGAVVVVAGGNGGRDTDRAGAFYPCSFPSDNVICVAAMDQAYALAAFSNYGAVSVDVGAPGTNAISAWPGESRTLDLAGWARFGWDLCSGTLTSSSVCASGSYANNADDRIRRIIDLSAVDLLGAGLGGYYRLRTADGSAPWPYTNSDPDALTAGANPVGSDPFESSGRTAYFPDTADGQVAPFALSLQDCLTPDCKIVLRFTSDGSGADAGPKIFSSTLRLAQRDADVYEYADGTSIAAAHTTGVAALAWAYNPTFTYADVVNAVKYGGDVLPALQSITATGRVVDAMGSLRYINRPSGVSATLR